ncbi:titin [Tetranychus urticae]|uniref:titin n=1 Tax=Tetranychus urticae TaxID=32264 RepID=UPI00077BA8A5|nr:titin [Tetranychus urticae]
MLMFTVLHLLLLSSDLITCSSDVLLEITVPVNGAAQIPCNVTLYGKDEVLLILWYQNANATGPPLYSLDFRESRPQHFLSTQFKNRMSLGTTFEPPYLLINPVNPSDDGYFSCRADFKWSRTKTQTIKLNVIVPPKGMFIRDRWDQPVYAIAGPYPQDSSMQLTCIAENGKPPPKILWYLNDTLVDESFEITDSSSSSLSSNVTSTLFVTNRLSIDKLDRSYYQSVLTCQAINNYHPSVPVSTSIRLDMYLKPLDVIITPVKEPLIAGKKVEIVCSTYGSKPPAKVNWLLRSRELKRTRLIHSPDGNSSTSTLIFTPSADDDGSILICQAQNPNIKNHFMEDKLPLKVLYKPKLSLDIVGDQKYAIQGSIVIIDCSVDANPPVKSIDWYFNDNRLIPDEPKGIRLENNSLLIMNPKPEQNEGNYRCGSSNFLGSAFSNYLFLSVFYAPVCRENDLKKNYEVRLGEAVEIKCLVDASSKTNLTFTWSASTSTNENRKLLTNYTSHSDTSYLYYRPTKVYDFGFIYCSAKNIVGHQLEPCIFTIKPVRDTPQTPKDCSLVNDTYHSILVTCSNDPSVSTPLPEVYCLEVYDIQTGSLVLFMEDRLPRFKVSLAGLKDISEHSLTIYAKNSFTRSASVNITLKGETQLLLNQVANSSHSDELIEEPFPYIACLVVLSGLIILILLVWLKLKGWKAGESEDKKSDIDSNMAQSETISTTTPDDCQMKDVSIKEAKRLAIINLKEQSKSSAPDIIELNCDSLVVNHNERQEKKPSLDDISEFILAQNESYPVHLILSEDDDLDKQQRVFCVSTLV